MRTADARAVIDQCPDDRGWRNQPEQRPAEAERDQSEYRDEKDREHDRNGQHDHIDDESNRPPHEQASEQVRLQVRVERMLVTRAASVPAAVTARTVICHDQSSRPYRRCWTWEPQSRLQGLFALRNGNISNSPDLN